MLYTISKFVGGSVLTFFGWNIHFNLEGVDDSNSIIIFPHTTIFDFFIIIWYFMTIPHKIPYLWILMKPQVFDHFGFILNRINCIRCPRNEDKASGFIKELVDKFSGKHFKILISPKGTREYRDKWRRGFWALATKLDANIVSYALDYNKKEMVYLGKYETEDFDYEHFVEHMKKLFADIPQMYPENEYGQDQSYHWLELLPFDPIVVSNNIMIISCLTLTFMTNGLAYILALIGSVSSFIYHHTKEKILKRLEFLISSFVMISLFILYNQLGKIRMDFIEALIILIITNTYILGMGRHKKDKREVRYILFHSLFHLSIPLLLLKVVLNEPNLAPCS